MSSPPGAGADEASAGVGSRSPGGGVVAGEADAAMAEAEQPAGDEGERLRLSREQVRAMHNVGPLKGKGGMGGKAKGTTSKPGKQPPASPTSKGQGGKKGNVDVYYKNTTTKKGGNKKGGAPVQSKKGKGGAGKDAEEGTNINEGYQEDGPPSAPSAEGEPAEQQVQALYPPAPSDGTFSSGLRLLGEDISAMHVDRDLRGQPDPSGEEAHAELAALRQRQFDLGEPVVEIDAAGRPIRAEPDDGAEKAIHPRSHAHPRTHAKYYRLMRDVYGLHERHLYPWSAWEAAQEPEEGPFLPAEPEVYPWESVFVVPPAEQPPPTYPWELYEIAPPQEMILPWEYYEQLENAKLPVVVPEQEYPWEAYEPAEAPLPVYPWDVVEQPMFQLLYDSSQAKVREASQKTGDFLEKQAEALRKTFGEDLVDKFGKKTLYGEIYEKTALQYHCEYVDEFCLSLLYDVSMDIYTAEIGLEGSDTHARWRLNPTEDVSDQHGASTGKKLNWYAQMEAEAMRRHRAEREYARRNKFHDPEASSPGEQEDEDGATDKSDAGDGEPSEKKKKAKPGKKEQKSFIGALLEGPNDDLIELKRGPNEAPAAPRKPDAKPPPDDRVSRNRLESPVRRLLVDSTLMKDDEHVVRLGSVGSELFITDLESGELTFTRRLCERALVRQMVVLMTALELQGSVRELLDDERDENTVSGEGLRGDAVVVERPHELVLERRNLDPKTRGYVYRMAQRDATKGSRADKGAGKKTMKTSKGGRESTDVEVYDEVELDLRLGTARIVRRTPPRKTAAGKKKAALQEVEGEVLLRLPGFDVGLLSAPAPNSYGREGATATGSSLPPAVTQQHPLVGVADYLLSIDKDMRRREHLHVQGSSKGKNSPTKKVFSPSARLFCTSCGSAVSSAALAQHVCAEVAKSDAASSNLFKKKSNLASAGDVDITSSDEDVDMVVGEHNDNLTPAALRSDPRDRIRISLQDRRQLVQMLNGVLHVLRDTRSSLRTAPSPEQEALVEEEIARLRQQNLEYLAALQENEERRELNMFQQRKRQLEQKRAKKTLAKKVATYTGREIVLKESSSDGAEDGGAGGDDDKNLEPFGFDALLGGVLGSPTNDGKRLSAQRLLELNAKLRKKAEKAPAVPYQLSLLASKVPPEQRASYGLVEYFPPVPGASRDPFRATSDAATAALMSASGPEVAGNEDDDYAKNQLASVLDGVYLDFTSHFPRIVIEKFASPEKEKEFEKQFKLGRGDLLLAILGERVTGIAKWDKKEQFLQPGEDDESGAAPSVEAAVLRKLRATAAKNVQILTSARGLEQVTGSAEHLDLSLLFLRRKYQEKFLSLSATAIHESEKEKPPRHFGMKIERKKIRAIEKNGWADKRGLQVGDEIFAIDDSTSKIDEWFKSEKNKVPGKALSPTTWKMVKKPEKSGRDSSRDAKKVKEYLPVCCFLVGRRSGAFALRGRIEVDASRPLPEKWLRRPKEEPAMELKMLQKLEAGETNIDIDSEKERVVAGEAAGVVGPPGDGGGREEEQVAGERGGGAGQPLGVRLQGREDEEPSGADPAFGVPFGAANDLQQPLLPAAEGMNEDDGAAERPDDGAEGALSGEDDPLGGVTDVLAEELLAPPVEDEKIPDDVELHFIPAALPVLPDNLPEADYADYAAYTETKQDVLYDLLLLQKAVKGFLGEARFYRDGYRRKALAILDEEAEVADAFLRNWTKQMKTWDEADRIEHARELAELEKKLEEERVKLMYLMEEEVKKRRRLKKEQRRAYALRLEEREGGAGTGAALLAMQEEASSDGSFGDDYSASGDVDWHWLVRQNRLRERVEADQRKKEARAKAKGGGKGEGTGRGKAKGPNVAAATSTRSAVVPGEDEDDEEAAAGQGVDEHHHVESDAVLLRKRVFSVTEDRIKQLKRKLNGKDRKSKNESSERTTKYGAKQAAIPFSLSSDPGHRHHDNFPTLPPTITSGRNEDAAGVTSTSSGLDQEQDLFAYWLGRARRRFPLLLYGLRDYGDDAEIERRELVSREGEVVVPVPRETKDRVASMLAFGDSPRYVDKKKLN
eukprot:g12433.t1